MRIELKGLPAIVVESEDGPDMDTLIERVMASGEMEAVIQETGSGSFYEKYQTWSDIGDKTAGDIAEALFSGGIEAAEEKIMEIVDESDTSAHEDYDHMVGPGGYRSFPNIDAISEAIADATDEDTDTVREALVEAMKDQVVEVMEESDRSVALNVIPSHARVEVIYFFGLDGLSFDDRYTQNVSNVSEIGTILPDERLAAVFEGLNVPFEGFREHVREAQGIDLKAGRKDEALVTYLTAADYIGDRDRARERALERADAWAAFEPRHDPEREPVLKNGDLLTVITESGYGGVPVFVARPQLKDLLAHDWDLPLRFEPDNAYGSNVRTGGFVGIYDPVNGSGYIERPSAPVDIPADLAGWGVSGRRGYKVDDTFGIVGTCYYATLKALPTPEAEPEAPAFGM